MITPVADLASVDDSAWKWPGLLFNDVTLHRFYRDEPDLPAGVYPGRAIGLYQGYRRDMVFSSALLHLAWETTTIIDPGIGIYGTIAANTCAWNTLHEEIADAIVHTYDIRPVRYKYLTPAECVEPSGHADDDDRYNSGYVPRGEGWGDSRKG